MKKALALLLAMLMLIGMLAGCSKKKENTDETNKSVQDILNQQNQDTQETGTIGLDQNFGVAIGTELDAPEKIFNTDTLDMFSVSFTVKGEGKSDDVIEISAVYIDENTTKIHAVNGPGEAEEAIYEITAEGVTKYIKASAKDPFTPDAEITPEAMQDELNGLAKYVQIFFMYQNSFTGIKYRKVADVTTSSPTGDIYIYDAISEGKNVGQVCINKDTGILVKAKDINNTASITVLKVATADVQIPEVTTAPAEGEQATPEA